MSCGDLVTNFEELAKRFTHEFNEIIEGKIAKLKEELDAYNAEKKRMETIDINGDDIVSLNVGGQKFTTTRSTLCQVQDSLLAIMFSGRWEDGLKRDQDGAVFFDCNPQYFGYVLEYLRTKRIATAEEPAELPQVPPGDLKYFTALLQYLGLRDEIVVHVAESNVGDPTEIVASEKFIIHGPEITLREEGKVAVHSPNRGFEFVLGENVYQQGIARLKLKLVAFENNGWLFVGIVKEDAAQLNNRSSYNWPASYGWELGWTGEVWQDGSRTIDNALKNLTKEGETVELVLDCDAAKLSLHLHNGQQFHIDLPKSTSWRLNVNMSRSNDIIKHLS
jgi:hypothetical protein